MGFLESIIFLSTLLLFFPTSTLLLWCHGQLLPIVGFHGADADLILTYIVHVKIPNGTEFLSDQDREDWHRSFLQNTTLDSGEPRLAYSYKHAISGFAARLTREEAMAMEAMEGFLRAELDMRLALQTTYTPTFLWLNQGKSLWHHTNYGEGVIIGVVDSGIFPAHPSFGDDGMPPPPAKWKGRCDFDASNCNNKLIGATAFLAGDHPIPVDSDGHGTHVASIAAGNFVADAEVLGNANGTASGMAPRAHLAIYKVCSSGYCRMSDTLAGIDRAIDDGVDVLSISVTSDSQSLNEDIISIGLLAATEKGIVVCAAAGNEGPLASTVKNDAPWILTVGASTTNRRITSTVKLGNGMEFDGESGYQPAGFDSKLLPTVYTTGLCKNGSLDDVDVQGKVVVCEAGDSTVLEKSKVVMEVGGAAMVVLNRASQANTTLADACFVPASNVNHNDSFIISSYLDPSTDSAPMSTIVFKGTQFGIGPSPAVASFSSRGPSLANGGVPKPDIVGPGANIVGAWPFQVGPDSTGSSPSTFNFQSGSSMSTPHIAGVAALLKKSHPEWSPAAIKSAIMTTANSLGHEGNTIVDEYDSKNATLFAMGAGHVNPLGANNPGLIYDLQSYDYIKYLCGMSYKDDEVTVITRREIQCSSAGNITAEDLNYPSILASLASAKRKIVTRTVTNIGHPNSTYSVKIDQPKGVKVRVKPKKLEFTGPDQTKSFRVKFRLKAKPKSKDEVLEGLVSWVSKEHIVRSPIAITFT